MGELDYAVEPEVQCPDDDPNDAAFVRVTATFEGRDAIEEYVACKTYPLEVETALRLFAVGTIAVSKVETALRLFAVGTIAAEHANRVLAKIETKAERVMGSFGPREYGALMAANIPNGAHLN
jgi:hypothetical protein